MRASVARSVTGRPRYSGMWRAMAMAMMLKVTTAKILNPTTAKQSHHDQAGKRGSVGAGETGSNGAVCSVSNGMPKFSETMGEGSGRFSIGSGSGLEGRDM